MDSFTTGIGGVVLGWLLSQGGFFFQRRVALRGEVSKAAYFLILLMEEVDSIIVLKEGGFCPKNHIERICDSFRKHFIGHVDFDKEVASICEKVSMVSVQQARNIRKSCMLIGQATKDMVKETRKIDENFASQFGAMSLEWLKFERYNLEQIVFHLLIMSDKKYFFRYCKELGYKRSLDHLLKRKMKSSPRTDDVHKVFRSALGVLNKIDE